MPARGPGDLCTAAPHCLRRTMVLPLLPLLHTLRTKQYGAGHNSKYDNEDKHGLDHHPVPCPMRRLAATDPGPRCHASTKRVPGTYFRSIALHVAVHDYTMHHFQARHEVEPLSERNLVVLCNPHGDSAVCVSTYSPCPMCSHRTAACRAGAAHPCTRHLDRTRKCVPGKKGRVTQLGFRVS